MLGQREEERPDPTPPGWALLRELWAVPAGRSSLSSATAWPPGQPNPGERGLARLPSAVLSTFTCRAVC